MLTKEKVTLTKEQETLLIPLFSKAQSSPIFEDVKARQILDAVQYDFGQLKVPRKTEVTLRIRAKQLDEYTRQFIAAHPNALVLHLGCGLDSRCERVSHPTALWIDLDFPDVIELRRKFYPESASYHLIASSVTDLSWMARAPAQGRPVLVVAEGLLMYLSEAQVKALILKLREVYPGCELACDVFSQFTAERVGGHRSLKQTGALIQWGIDDAHEIEQWATGIRLKEEWYFNQAEEVSRLGAGYRLMFRLAGMSQMANKAHRILYYAL